MTELVLNGIAGGLISLEQRSTKQLLIDLNGQRLVIDRSQINWLKLFLQETEKVFDKG